MKNIKLMFIALMMGMSAISANSQKIRVSVEFGDKDILIKERHKVNGVYTAWKSKKAIDGGNVITSKGANDYSMNLSQNFEYSIVTVDQNLEPNPDDLTIAYKGDAFKNKTVWSVGYQFENSKMGFDSWNELN